MGYPTKVQLIQRKESQQWYINFPAAIAQAMEFSKGEDVQWTVADKGHLFFTQLRKLQYFREVSDLIVRTLAHVSNSQVSCSSLNCARRARWR